MSIFKDVNGREWRIRLTGPLLEKVREATKIILADPGGQGAVAATVDGETFTRVLWLLCGDQEVEGRKLKPDQFGEVVANGEVFEAAGIALQEAIRDFTPPLQRPMLEAGLEQARESQAALTEVAMQEMTGDELRDQVCQAFRVRCKRELKEILTRLENVGGSLASPDSTPTTPPSES